MLLNRDEFRERGFQRDQYKCVICSAPAIDFHHIIERRLFTDYGYYLDNGASLCQAHHIKAEETTLSCDEIRKAAGIKNIVIPAHLYKDDAYDKWGNIILPNGMRARGELFNDESVQKILKQGNVLQFFADKIKYPRTYHLNFSPGLTNDDRVMDDMSNFVGKDIICCVKMDGENTTAAKNYIHARSLDYAHHPSRDRVRALHGKIAHEIPEGWRLSIENLYAKHSIHYKNLKDYNYLFGIWNEKNTLISWDETKEWAQLLDLTMCPILYEGKWDEKLIKNLYRPIYDGDECEGFVVRIRDEIQYRDFRKYVGKYVRKNHVNSETHWKVNKFIPNELSNGAI